MYDKEKEEKDGGKLTLFLLVREFGLIIGVQMSLK
jgi:hypothetical protein